MRSNKLYTALYALLPSPAPPFSAASSLVVPRIAGASRLRLALRTSALDGCYLRATAFIRPEEPPPRFATDRAESETSFFVLWRAGRRESAEKFGFNARD